MSRLRRIRSAGSAHNDIVNVATELGIPAAIVACVYLFGALSNAARLFEREASTFSFFALGFLVGTAVIGFAETHLLRIHSFFWILFVALTVTVKHELDGRVPTARIGTEHDGCADNGKPQLRSGDSGPQRGGVHRADARSRWSCRRKRRFDGSS